MVECELCGKQTPKSEARKLRLERKGVWVGWAWICPTCDFHNGNDKILAKIQEKWRNN